MKTTLNIAGTLLVLQWAIWFLQGANVLPGSFSGRCTGDRGGGGYYDIVGQQTAEKSPELTVSLTSFLQQNRDVRQYLNAAFCKPKMPRSVLIASPLTKNPTILGTAFDYLMRLMLRKINPGDIERDHWVAEGAVAMLPDQSIQKRGHRIVQNARTFFKDFLSGGDLSDDVIAAAWHLAQLDTFFRTRRYAELIGAAPMGVDIQDLRALIAALPLDQFKAKTKCYLNPTFGYASIAIGGADADLIVDDLLLEIKVRRDALTHTEDFHQLISYYLLYEIGGVDGVHYLPGVKRLGFYCARYRLLATWSVAELIGSISLAESIEWFRNRLGMNEVASIKSTPPKAQRKRRSRRGPDTFAEKNDGQSGEPTHRIKTGQIVEHPQYGMGTVIRREGQDRIAIVFRRVGMKKLKASAVQPIP